VPRSLRAGAICLHTCLRWILPCCRLESRTYTRHPNGFQCSAFGLTFVSANTCRGDCRVATRKLGVSFKTSFAMRAAHGHRFAVATFGHLLLAWISIVLASPCSSPMRRSAIPFWWWAFAAANDKPWPWLRHAATHLFARNIPLSAW
jgi:hypothetical protein